MKKILFLLSLFVSSVFGGSSVWVTSGTPSDYNPTTDRLTVRYTGSYPNYYQYKSANPIDGFITNPTFSRCSGGWYSSADNSYYKCDTIDYLAYDDNYQCPAGQEVINGACAASPACPALKQWDSSTDTCVPMSGPDADGDTIPDKCDFDHPDFKILDCDSDGKMNSADPNMDGDATDDIYDSDMNNDGTPDAQQPGSPTYNPNCQGADLSREYVRSGVNYPTSTYYLKGNMFPSQCMALANTDNIDSTFSAYDKNPQCNAVYCYVHVLKPDCSDKAADYIPKGSGWIYRAGMQSQTQCNALVDNKKYSQSTFEAPNLSDCPDNKYCFLKRVTDVPDANNTQPIPENIDTNRTSLDLQPLLEAHNKSNEHLTDIKTKIETTNTKLEDLKGVSNEILNKNESMDSSLKSLKSNSDKSLKNDLEALSTLGNIANATQKGNDINKAFSDISTKNQVIGNEHLSSIDGKMNTNNSLLTSIDNYLKGDGTSPDTSALDGAESALTDFGSFVDSVTSQFSTFKGNIQGNMDDVTNQYNNAKSLLTSGQAPTMSGGGSLECASFNVFGKHVVLDLSFLSVLSPVFYYIFTAYFMFLNFSFLIRHLFGSGN